MPPTYKLGQGSVVYRVDEDGKVWGFDFDPEAPLADLSGIAQQYRAWLEDDNTPAPADPIPEPEPSKNEILLMMLEGLEPGSESDEIVWIVLQESLRP